MMTFLQRLVALRAAVPSEVDGCLSCFYCNAQFFSSTDESDASKHAPDCLYVQATRALADLTSGNGCTVHGLAHPCEACAAELPLMDALRLALPILSDVRNGRVPFAGAAQRAQAAVEAALRTAGVTPVEAPSWEHQCPKRPPSAPRTVLPSGEACDRCGAAGVALPRDGQPE